jgi:hypothetical protein
MWILPPTHGEPCSSAFEIASFAAIVIWYLTPSSKPASAAAASMNVRASWSPSASAEIVTFLRIRGGTLVLVTAGPRSRRYGLGRGSELVSTTSKSRPWMRHSDHTCCWSQRSEGTPERCHGAPLLATNTP